MTGEYTCEIGSFKSDDRRSQYLQMIVPETDLKLSVDEVFDDKRGEDGLSIECIAKNIYPEPKLTILYVFCCIYFSDFQLKFQFKKIKKKIFFFSNVIHGLIAGQTPVSLYQDHVTMLPPVFIQQQYLPLCIQIKRVSFAFWTSMERIINDQQTIRHQVNNYRVQSK